MRDIEMEAVDRRHLRFLEIRAQKNSSNTRAELAIAFIVGAFSTLVLQMVVR